MYYKNENGNLVQSDKLNASVAVLTLDEFKNEYKNMNISEESLSLLNKKSTYSNNRFEVYEDCSVACISILNQYKKSNRIAMFIRKNILVIVILEDTDGFAVKTLEDCIKITSSKFSVEKIIASILNKTISTSIDIIEKYNDLILKIEDKIVNNKTNKNINHDMFMLKKRLTYYFKYYKSLIRILEMLEEDNNDILEDSECRNLNIVDMRIERIANDIEYLIEDLKHVQDLYGASLDYVQNNTMKVFTVVTTIFLPLTLITGWYGMNFKYMPELSYKYGYISVIGVCIAIVILCIIFFKKKKLM